MRYLCTILAVLFACAPAYADTGDTSDAFKQAFGGRITNASTAAAGTVPTKNADGTITWAAGGGGGSPTGAAGGDLSGTYPNPTVSKVAGVTPGSASGVATLNGSTLVVQNPANATATPTASKIVIADGSGKVTTWVSNMVGDSGSGGTAGLVPAPGSGDAAAGKYLKADGTFAVPSGTGSFSGVLGVGNTTGGHDIVITSGDKITTSSNADLKIIPNGTGRTYITGGTATGVVGTCACQVDGTIVAANDLRALLYLVDNASTAAGIGPGIGFGYKYDSTNYTIGGGIQLLKETGSSGYASSVVLVSRVGGGSILNRLAVDSSGLVRVCSDSVYGFTSSTTDPTVATALDLGLSRDAAGVAALGNGTQGDASGTLKTTNITSPAATTLALQRAGTTVESIVGIPTTSAATSLITLAGFNGSSVSRGVLHTSTTLSTGATSTNLAVNVPAGAIVYAVTTRVTTTITTAINYSLQDASGNSYINATTNVTATNTTNGAPGAAGAFFYNYYSSANTFKLVTNANPGAGVVETEIYYYLITAPTS